MANVDLEKFAEGVRKYMGQQIAPYVRRIEALEKEVASIQTRGIFYRGTWRVSDTYKTGDAVTHEGSLWIATAATSGRPPGNGWLLAVKSGR